MKLTYEEYHHLSLLADATVLKLGKTADFYLEKFKFSNLGQVAQCIRKLDESNEQAKVFIRISKGKK